MKHQLKALFLLLAVLLSTIASAHNFEADGIYYNINGNEATVTYQGTYSSQYSNEYSGDVAIPPTVIHNGTTYPVTEIGSSAFSYCTGLTSVTIPNSVTTIGNYAFRGCSGLTSVTIPNSVTEIGEGAFWGCSGLTSVTIPNSVTVIGDEAFRGCSGLINMAVDPANTVYDSRNDCNAIIETASNKLITGCKNTVIPNSVTTIGSYAFWGCSGLTSVTIPNSVTEIGWGAFLGCSGLTNISFPITLTSIGGLAFYDTAWFNNQPNGVVYAGQFAIDYKGKMSNDTIIIKEGTRGIADFAFGTTEEEGKKNDNNMIFSHQPNLLNIIIPNTVIYIGYQAFASTSLKSISIPNSVRKIDINAFQNCNKLIELSIGNSVTSIAYGTFAGCDAIQSVYSYNPIPPTCYDRTFTNYSATLHVPAASLAAYFTAPFWSNFVNIIGDAVPPSGITISQDSVEIQLGEQLQLNATVTPVNTSHKEVIWNSSNSAVATVENGMVTAVGNGECDIVAYCFGMQAVCHIIVYNRIQLDLQDAMLLPNHMMTLTPTAPVMPEGFTVISSDPTVAAARVMNGKVQVVGIKEGTTTITVGSADGAATPASCFVTVYTEKGDLNMDGFVNMDDLSAMINYLLTDDGTGISLVNAGGCDGIDGVGMDDLSAMINFLLTGQWPLEMMSSVELDVVEHLTTNNPIKYPIDKPQRYDNRLF